MGDEGSSREELHSNHNIPMNFFTFDIKNIPNHYISQLIWCEKLGELRNTKVSVAFGTRQSWKG